AQQCVELTNTNRSRAYPNKQLKRFSNFRIQFSGRNQDVAMDKLHQDKAICTWHLVMPLPDLASDPERFK
ncbi:hypothetical protein ACFQZE_17490, partial [Paenibacillus sp. GCM10027627]|uniref:hypothetical protein n=1 Tax=unclassified Paenibacillus TaxID=185978 RepID=UPI003628DA75